MEYLTVRETSEKWGMSIRMVNYYLNTGRIAGGLFPKRIMPPSYSLIKKTPRTAEYPSNDCFDIWRCVFIYITKLM